MWFTRIGSRQFLRNYTKQDDLLVLVFQGSENQTWTKSVFFGENRWDRSNIDNMPRRGMMQNHNSKVVRHFFAPSRLKVSGLKTPFERIGTVVTRRNYCSAFDQQQLVFPRGTSVGGLRRKTLACVIQRTIHIFWFFLYENVTRSFVVFLFGCHRCGSRI